MDLYLPHFTVHGESDGVLWHAVWRSVTHVPAEHAELDRLAGWELHYEDTSGRQETTLPLAPAWDESEDGERWVEELTPFVEAVLFPEP